jgi:hypothetical protein
MHIFFRICQVARESKKYHAARRVAGSKKGDKPASLIS